MIVVRCMSARDLRLGLDLSDQEGWNQTAADWRRFFALQPRGCFVAEIDGQPVGTVTTCLFERVGWVGMLLVHTTCRRRGVGRALIQQAIAYLESQDATSIRLDATSMGEPLYRNLGFVAQHRVIRFAGVFVEHAVATAICPMRREHWDEVCALDKRVIGYDRGRLLIRLLQEPDTRACVDRRGDLAEGYVLARPGTRAVQIGPCLATTTAVGRRLLVSAMRLYRGQNAFVDVPSDNIAAVEAVSSCGLEPARELVRMCRGIPAVEQLDCLWASSGPEKG